MIVVDKVQNWGHRYGASCHMMSDVIGEEGQKELIAFAVRIGLKPNWLQNKGTETEHFDLFGSRIERALKAGAVQIDRNRLVEIVRSKRAARMNT